MTSLDISFMASERNGEAITIDDDHVREKVGELAKDVDLRKFIL